MSTAETIAARSVESGIDSGFPDVQDSIGTATQAFQDVEDLVSDRPLRRPNRNRPMELSNAELRRLAADPDNQPPDAWWRQTDSPFEPLDE